MTMAEAELAPMLKMAKDKRMFFACVIKGADGKLLVSKTKIPPKQIDETKKEVGGGTPLKGRCTGHLDAMVFQVAKEVSGTLAATLKKIIKRDAGLAVNLEFQVAHDAESEEGESEEGQAPPVPPPSPPGTKPQAVAGIEVVKKFLALKPSFDQAVARKGPDVAKLQALHERIKGLLDRREFAEAATALPELEALIAKAQAGGPTSEGPGRAVVGWQAARTEATHTLRKLEALVAKTKHPIAGETVTLLEAVIKRLSGEVKTKQQAQDLAHYLEADQDVADLEETPVEGTTYSIRPALLKALQALQGQLPT
jgi:hypothetical protein